MPRHRSSDPTPSAREPCLRGARRRCNSENAAPSLQSYSGPVTRSRRRVTNLDQLRVSNSATTDIKPELISLPAFETKPEVPEVTETKTEVNETSDSGIKLVFRPPLRRLAAPFQLQPVPNKLPFEQVLEPHTPGSSLPATPTSLPASPAASVLDLDFHMLNGDSHASTPTSSAETPLQTPPQSPRANVCRNPFGSPSTYEPNFTAGFEHLYPVNLINPNGDAVIPALRDKKRIITVSKNTSLYNLWLPPMDEPGQHTNFHFVTPAMAACDLPPVPRTKLVLNPQNTYETGAKPIETSTITRARRVCLGNELGVGQGASCLMFPHIWGSTPASCLNCKRPFFTNNDNESVAATAN